MRHSNVELGLDDVNEKLGVASFDGSGGDDVIVVSGAVTSIVHVKLAGDASVLPTASVARTSKVWLPAESAGEIVSGLVQDVHEPPSIRHSKVEPPSVEVKEKLGVVLLDGSLGFAVIVVSGAVASTVHV